MQPTNLVSAEALAKADGFRKVGDHESTFTAARERKPLKSVPILITHRFTLDKNSRRLRYLRQGAGYAGAQSDYQRLE